MGGDKGRVMSQRLYVGKTEEKWPDCIIDRVEGAQGKLLEEWLCWTGLFFLGPWKIRIGDMELFRELNSVLRKTFEVVGRKYPKDVWVFYWNDRTIEHPTEEQLERWLRGCISISAE